LGIGSWGLIGRASTADLVHTEAVQPTVDEIRQQLDRLLTSHAFANADRMSSFLRYVVERALAGESDQVKEYAIGVEVFGRDERYDPRLDSIVRVEARRLRSKVDEYYAHDGCHDPVIIRLRRGSYVPVFERREGSAAAPTGDRGSQESSVRTRMGWRLGLGLAAAVLAFSSLAAWRGGLWTPTGRPASAVTVAVLSFSQYSTNAPDQLLAARLTDGVTAELARLGTVGVVSHTSALQFAGNRRPLQEIAKALNANVVVEGSVMREGDRVRVSARLIDATSDRKFWVEDFVGPASDLHELERRIAVAVGSAAQHLGARSR
jgi:TolB-like protein